MASLDRSLLTNQPLFSGLRPDELDEFVREAQSIRYPKGTNVFQQDEEAHSFFVLLHGHLRVFKLTQDGQQVVVRFVTPGEVFGVAMAIGRKVENGVRIDFPISRQDVAEMTGTTLHTVSRILSAWEDKGLVEGGRQRIVLRDTHRLHGLAEEAAQT